jgi:hypothetical protein
MFAWSRQDHEQRFVDTMKQHVSKYLIAILVLSVAVRLAVALYLGNEIDAPASLTDQRSYHALGARLISGYGFSFERDWYPFTPADTPTAHWSFLYSLFVAGVYGLLGVNPLAVRLVQAVVGGVLLPWMVYRLAKVIFHPGVVKGPREAEIVPLLAALIAALYTYFVLYSATLMTETLYIVCVLWSLERGIVLARKIRDGAPLRALWPVAISLSLSLGFGTLLRQSLLPWVPVLFLYLLWVAWRMRRFRTAVVLLGSVTLILVAFILPWTVRNYLVFDNLLLLNSNTGFAMYSAQHPMHGTSFREFDAAPLPDGSWGRLEPELDRDLLRQGIQFVLDEPVRYVLLSLSRVRAFFEFWPTPDTTLLHNVGRTASFGLFLPFMVIGLIMAVRRPRMLTDNALLFLFALAYTVLHVLTWAMVRYRLPVDAALIPFAALAIGVMLQRIWAALPRQVDRGSADAREIHS